jgi:hypothetical protein
MWSDGTREVDGLLHVIGSVRVTEAGEISADWVRIGSSSPFESGSAARSCELTFALSIALSWMRFLKPQLEIRTVHLD